MSARGRATSALALILSGSNERTSRGPLTRSASSTAATSLPGCLSSGSGGLGSDGLSGLSVPLGLTSGPLHRVGPAYYATSHDDMSLLNSAISASIAAAAAAHPLTGSNNMSTLTTSGLGGVGPSGCMFVSEASGFTASAGLLYTSLSSGHSILPGIPASFQLIGDGQYTRKGDKEEGYLEYAANQADFEEDSLSTDEDNNDEDESDGEVSDQAHLRGQSWRRERDRHRLRHPFPKFARGQNENTRFGSASSTTSKVPQPFSTLDAARFTAIPNPSGRERADSQHAISSTGELVEQQAFSSVRIRHSFGSGLSRVDLTSGDGCGDSSICRHRIESGVAGPTPACSSSNTNELTNPVRSIFTHSRIGNSCSCSSSALPTGGSCASQLPVSLACMAPRVSGANACSASTSARPWTHLTKQQLVYRRLYGLIDHPSVSLVRTRPSSRFFGLGYQLLAPSSPYTLASHYSHTYTTASLNRPGATIVTCPMSSGHTDTLHRRASAGFPTDVLTSTGADPSCGGGLFARRSFTLGGVGHARSSRQAITATHSGGGLLNIGKPILTQLQPHSAERDFSLDQFSPVAVTTSSHAPMAMEACDQTLTALVWPQQPDTRIASSSTPISSITSSICASASSSESSSQLPLRELNQSTAASPALSLSSTLCPDNSSDHQQRHQPSLNLSDNLGERVATIWTQGMPFCAPVERTVSVNQPNEDYDAMDEVGPAIILSLSPSNSLNTSRCRRNSDPEHWQQVRPEASVLTPPVVVPSGVCRDPVPSLFPGPLPPLLFPSDSLSNVVTSELPALQPIAADGFLIAAPDQLLPSSTGFGTGLGLCPIQTGSVCQAKSVSLPPLASPPKQTSESQHPTLYFSPLPLLLSPSNSITPCTTTKYTTSFTSQGDCCANRLPPSLSRSSPSDFCTSHQMASTLLTVAGFRSPGLAPQPHPPVSSPSLHPTCSVSLNCPLSVSSPLAFGLSGLSESTKLPHSFGSHSVTAGRKTEISEELHARSQKVLAEQSEYEKNSTPLKPTLASEEDGIRGQQQRILLNDLQQQQRHQLEHVMQQTPQPQHQQQLPLSDISVDDLASYMEHTVHIPGRMSDMAQRMYL